MKNKYNILIFGGYGLILLMFMYFACQLVPIHEGFINLMYGLASLSLWISIVYFIIAIWSKCASVFKDFLKSINGKGEE